MLKLPQIVSLLIKPTQLSENCLSTSKRLLSVTSCLNRKLDSRAHPPYKFPSNKNGRWVERKSMKELYEYTVDPLPFPRFGGRGPNGRIWNHKRGGGLKKVFYMIDQMRANENLMPEGSSVLVEKVMEIKPDQNRTGFIALVAGGENKRYVTATAEMKVGDIIRSTNQISKAQVNPVQGYAYPLASLPRETVICCIEKFPGMGAVFARSAGSSAVLVKKEFKDGEEMAWVKMPSKGEIVISSKCMATVGRVSNENHDLKKLRKAGEKRWLGIRPRSGKWHRKTGRHGYKKRLLPPRPRFYKEMKPKKTYNSFTCPKNPGLHQYARF